MRALAILSTVGMSLACCNERPRAATALHVDFVTTPGGHQLERVGAAATGLGLVGYNGRGEVVPALASSWRIAANGRSVIFRLRPTMATGNILTANDVVATLRRSAAMASRNPARTLLGALANGRAVLTGRLPGHELGVDAPVSDVVEVRAEGFSPSLLALFAQPEFGVLAAAPNASKLGPMKVVSTGEPLVLTRNNRAATGPGEPASIVVAADADAGKAIARFARGRTDLVIGGGLAGFDDARLITTSNALRVEPSWGVYGYVVNLRGPLADAGVRRALAMAIDRDDLGSRLFGVALPPVLGLVPPLPSDPIPVLPDWAVQSPAARLEQARRLLAAADFDGDHPLNVTISLPEGREHANVAAEVASDWARIGVRATTITRSAAGHAAAVARQDFDLALVERSAPLDSPFIFLDPFACGETSYCNRTVDTLVATARSAPDAVSAATTLAAAEAALVADTPFISLFAPIRWALISPRVIGWYANAAGQHPLALLRLAGEHSTPR